MESAFQESFLRALKKALIQVVSDPPVQKATKNALGQALKREGVSMNFTDEQIRQLSAYCLGTLAADAALRAIFEDESDSFQLFQKRFSDEFLRVTSDKALAIVLENCNVKRAKTQFGIESTENIAEKLSTEDIYQTPEFEQACAVLEQVVRAAIKESSKTP
ncbi:hypothetical protein KEJ26_06640 [Candidatus Bathyarchaeota archaeon]|nr:hypothetical protein [Candidatus Bathyarchaeota archaeon]